MAETTCDCTCHEYEMDDTCHKCKQGCPILQIAEIICNKYQTKFINELIDQLWVKTREIKNSKLAIDIMGLLAEVKTSINDTEVFTHS